MITTKMNREIKFRAWHEQGKMIGWEELKYFVDLGSCFNDYKTLTLMQYTGLKDKNGKEIYEGDVVVFDEFIPGNKQSAGQWIQNRSLKSLSISFKHGYFGVKGSGDDHISLYSAQSEHCEIIGNIYENPELLN